MSKSGHFCLIMLLFIGATRPAFGQTENNGPIITDRPTQTVSAFLVPKGAFQIESGYQFLSDNNGFSITIGLQTTTSKRQMITLNTTTLRYGLSNNLEIRLTQGVNKERSKSGDHITSNMDYQFSPSAIGFKLHLKEGQGTGTQISLFGEVGGNVFGQDVRQSTYSDLRLNFNNDFNGISFDYNLGWQTREGVQGPNYFYSVAMGFNVDNKFSLYIEPYGIFNGSSFPDHRITGGVIIPVGKNFQADIYGGRALRNDGFHTIFGFGFSGRFLRK